MIITQEVYEQILSKYLWQGIRERSEVTLPDVQKWLRDKHDIHIVIDREAISSTEMNYKYVVTYVKPEHKTERNWINLLTRIDSRHEYGTTYYGGWDGYEQALEEAIKFSLTLIEKP